MFKKKRYYKILIFENRDHYAESWKKILGSRLKKEVMVKLFIFNSQRDRINIDQRIEFNIQNRHTRMPKYDAMVGAPGMVGGLKIAP